MNTEKRMYEQLFIELIKGLHRLEIKELREFNFTLNKILDRILKDDNG